MLNHTLLRGFGVACTSRNSRGFLQIGITGSDVFNPLQTARMNAQFAINMPGSGQHNPHPNIAGIAAWKIEHIRDQLRGTYVDMSFPLR
jgi:hypothetical protein